MTFEEREELSRLNRVYYHIWNRILEYLPNVNTELIKKMDTGNWMTIGQNNICGEYKRMLTGGTIPAWECEWLMNLFGFQLPRHVNPMTVDELTKLIATDVWWSDWTYEERYL